MNLLQLKQKVDYAIEMAGENEDTPENIEVSIQIEGPEGDSVYSNNIELHYDGDCQASGCVLVGEVTGKS